MTASLSRAMVEAQIEQFVHGTLSPQSLAAWAFTQVCDEEEGLVHYESGYADVISAVLDDLMWADEAAFRIDHRTAQQLKARLHHEQTNPQENVEPAESSASSDG
jgi:hypothetical protein